ncbi:MAG: T9SS C-terminal target domain-containing protein [Bacteroidetes bacterium]|nr:MAG: T9SS C-terminal target domain-containing protein [Bacteroidota bacterium]
MTKKMFKYIFLLLVFLQNFDAKAQLILENIKGLPKNNSFRVEDDILDTLRLKIPFWEDFSAYQGRPNPQKWVADGGTLVNNTYGIGAPSQGVVTFDGLDAQGSPYNFIEPKTVGYGDNLTSRRIDLSNTDIRRTVILSFYWQRQGNGELPDSEDFMELQFKAKTGEWVTKWTQKGGDAEGFNYQIVLINQAEFLHADFRFRFRSSQRLSGMYDSWNLDYIMLGNTREANQESILDLATSKTLNSYLKDYQAMPIQQYYADPKKSKADTVSATLNNLHDFFNVFNFRIELKELKTNQFITVLRDSSTSITSWRRDFPMNARTFALPANLKKMEIQTKFIVKSGEKDPLLNFRINDTLSRNTILDDYYAYDDGSAEYIVGVQQKFGRFAYQFDLNKMDLLTHIDLCFIPSGINLKGETVNLYVWKKLKKIDGAEKDSAMLIQNIPIEYADSLNKFTRIKLNRSLQMEGKFYIGLEQLTEKSFTLGYDANINSGEKMFYDVSNEWQKAKLKGSLMFRPVFASKDGVTATENDILDKLNVKIYPNPSNQAQIWLEGEVSKATLYDLNGRTLGNYEFDIFGEKMIVLPENLSDGMYLLHCANKNKVSVEKLILFR